MSYPIHAFVVFGTTLPITHNLLPSKTSFLHRSHQFPNHPQNSTTPHPSPLLKIRASSTNPGGITSSSTPEKPAWAGSDPLSRFVNMLIAFPPLYALMKIQARKVLRNTAEKRGVTWTRDYHYLQEQKDVLQIYYEEFERDLKEDPENGGLFPDYYLVPFHAYDKGNLCWDAAWEAEAATKAMALRVWKEEQDLSWESAQLRLRKGIYQHLVRYGPPLNQVSHILDVGCSVGMSTYYLRNYYLEQKGNSNASTADLHVTGLDLSPYMLSVAKFRDADQSITWTCGRAEQTKFPGNQFDVVTLQFVVHELPEIAAKNIFKEMYRVMKPGAVLSVTDNNPRSPVIQNLPPVLFTLMKSTEPWSDQYYLMDIEGALGEAGFHVCETVDSDIRHRTIIAKKL